MLRLSLTPALLPLLPCACSRPLAETAANRLVAALLMGHDAFGPRHGCKLCACADFCSELDSMDVEARDEILTRGYLTCQRKSELVLICSCGHNSWKHHEQPISTQHYPPGDVPRPAGDMCTELHQCLAVSDLHHLAEQLSTTTFQECCHRLKERPAFLQWLKRSGIVVLKDRQAVANAVSRRRREREASERDATVQSAHSSSPSSSA